MLAGCRRARHRDQPGAWRVRAKKHPTACLRRTQRPHGNRCDSQGQEGDQVGRVPRRHDTVQSSIAKRACCAAPSSRGKKEGNDGSTSTLCLLEELGDAKCPPRGWTRRSRQWRNVADDSGPDRPTPPPICPNQCVEGLSGSLRDA